MSLLNLRVDVQEVREPLTVALKTEMCQLLTNLMCCSLSSVSQGSRDNQHVTSEQSEQSFTYSHRYILWIHFGLQFALLLISVECITLGHLGEIGLMSRGIENPLLSYAKANDIIASQLTLADGNWSDHEGLLPYGTGCLTGLRSSGTCCWWVLLSSLTSSRFKQTQFLRANWRHLLDWHHRTHVWFLWKVRFLCE